MRDPESITVNEDARLIPVWSIVTAIAAFVARRVLHVDGAARAAPSPRTADRFQDLLQRLVGPAGRRFYFLMVGYVSKDAPRRAMSARFWMLICFVMPGGIGAVLYFLLRQPLVSRCPACSTFVQSDFHFCPQCNYQLTASCGNCFRTVRATDQFCTRCGHELAADQMPARLRVMAE